MSRFRRWNRARTPIAATGSSEESSMLFARWLKSAPAKKLTTRNRYRPLVEGLEERCVPTTFRVAPSGSDSADGVNSPFASIQRAINAAAPSGDTILLAAGTYGYNASQD